MMMEELSTSEMLLILTKLREVTSQKTVTFMYNTETQTEQG
jgi:hypothetical protein